MNKKSIIAIENILSIITELKILTNNRDDNYFYDGYEMPILCDLVHDVELYIDKISNNIKNKYINIDWNIIKKLYEYDGENNGKKIYSLKLGKIWELASHLLYDNFYNKLKTVLEKELPIYYNRYANMMHNKVIKERNLNEK